MRYGIVFCLTLLMSQLSFGQTGTIRGTVMDAELGETLIGAAVVLQGTTTGAPTDLDGAYSIENLEPGTYTLVCKYIAYDDVVLEGVVVKAGEVTVQDFDMGAAAIELGNGVTITAVQNKANDNYMLSMQKKSATVMDGMSADQIARTGDSDAAGAAKRVTGVSIEGGKYVYVRGLSDRYSKTLLNGAEIPGLDPNRNSVQLDLFPTSLIGNMTISKSFSPDLPGSFTGGLVNLETKDFPERFTLQFSTSQGYNTQANFNGNYLTYKGGSFDFLGMDDGTRAIPDQVAQNGVPNRFEDPAGTTAGTRSFDKTWGPSTKSSLQNQSYSFSVGNQTKLFGRTLGFNVGLTYRQNYEYYNNGTTERYSLTGNYADAFRLNLEKELTDERSDQSVIWGALANLSYKINSAHKIGLTIMQNQNGVSSARYQMGRNPSDASDLFVEQRSLRYLERNMWANQLKGEHYFENFHKMKIDWVSSFTLSSQETPDLRVFTNDFQLINSDADTLYRISANLYPVPTRYYRDMKETNFDTKLNISMPFKFRGDESTVKVGGSNVMKHRDFEENWYQFYSNNINYDGNPGAYFTDANMDASSDSYIFAVDATDLQNTYSADEHNIAAYAMTDLKWSKRFRVIAGARLETTDIQVESAKYAEIENEIAAETDPEVIQNLTDQLPKYRGELKTADILPALNTVYALNEKQNLRFGYSRTLARPSFREIAPFSSFDFDFQFVKIGNPDLDRTLIDNLDLRWEWFPNAGELISASIYYKRFDNPIELVINPVAANIELTWKNQEYANLYGAEVEVRKNLGFITSKLENFSAGTNATFVQSETKIDPAELEQIRANDPSQAETRVMFGQSPYIVNAFLGYKNDSSGVAANLNFNISGEKMVLVTKGATPDVFDQPVGRLDFNISKKFGKHWNVKFSARNLLNPTTRQIYTFKGKEYDFQTYKRGRTFSIGIKYLIK